MGGQIDSTLKISIMYVLTVSLKTACQFGSSELVISVSSLFSFSCFDK